MRTRIAASKYRKMQSVLDAHSILISIQRVDKCSYNLIINGTIVKNYRQRQSCNNRIVKMYNQLNP
jgi:hypothetical protein